MCKLNLLDYSTCTVSNEAPILSHRRPSDTLDAFDAFLALDAGDSEMVHLKLVNTRKRFKQPKK